MLNENIKNLRKQKGLSQEELAAKLYVVRQTVSKWENGLSVPDSEMIISLANELGTTVSDLLGETIIENKINDLKIISEKLEIINLQLANKRIENIKRKRIVSIAICLVIVVIFIVLCLFGSSYLNWNYNDPELAVIGTFLHGFEFVFVRVAPIVFVLSLIGIIYTHFKRWNIVYIPFVRVAYWVARTVFWEQNNIYYKLL